MKRSHAGSSNCVMLFAALLKIRMIRFRLAMMELAVRR